MITKTDLETRCYICTDCRRELPASAFRVNKHTQLRDAYCMDCRRALNRYRSRLSWLTEQEPHHYPVITALPDRSQRITLLRHAKLVVRTRIEHKRKETAEKEFLQL